MSKDSWNGGEAYEHFMGRWSKVMAPVFLKWLAFPENKSWLDLGCGTGALSEAIYRHTKPAHLWSVDPSVDFLEKASESLFMKADVRMGTASDIPASTDSFDIIVSGLALNFFPDLKKALAEMQRVVKPGGTIAAYVWDYAARMDFLRIFWDEAGSLDPEAKKLDEGVRFPICTLDNLQLAFRDSGLTAVVACYLDITTKFESFEDYWIPFTGGQGPAPGYLATLSEDARDALKANVQKRLPIDADGSITLLARAIAVRGQVPT